MAIISVESLTKVYSKVIAVDGVTFEVAQGGIFGFLGPNGAGKSTTINMLCTLTRPSSGTARVDGFDCIREPGKVRRSIGIVFQDSTLDKELTAYENLYYHALLYRVERKSIKSKVEEALRFFDLHDRKDDFVKKFSGGMKRKLEVARALIHQPKILFLDEPTIGLDPQSRANLWGYVTSLPAALGLTVFMTTHYMEEAEVCSAIAVIDKGKIVAQGSPSQMKEALGAEVVYLKARDNQAAMARVQELLGVVPIQEEKEFFISCEKAEECIPLLIRTLGSDLLSVRLQKPTMNDVFLQLTGRALREEETTQGTSMRESVRAYRRRMDDRR